VNLIEKSVQTSSGPRAEARPRRRGLALLAVAAALLAAAAPDAIESVD